MIKVLVLLSLFILQDGSNSTIKKLQSKFDTINYLQADFSQGADLQNTLYGKFYFAKKNKYRIELKNNIIISDGISIWNEDLNRKKVIISNLDEDPLAFSLREYIYDYPNKCEVTEVKNGNEILLIFNAEKSDLSFKTARVTLNSDYLIKQINIIDFSGNSFSLFFDNILINKKFNKSSFEFNPKEKLKIIDLRY